MILAWDNKVDAATVTAGSEIATLPGSNVKTAHLSQKWATLAGVKSSSLTLDLGSHMACSLFALLGSNLTAAAAIRVRASKTDAAATSALEFDTGKMPGLVKSGYGAAYKQLAKGKYISVASDEVPNIAYDFTAGHLTDLIGTGIVTVTRSGTATRINAIGLVEVVPADSPRVDYNPATLVCDGLLVEVSRTNVLLRSEDFNTTWTKTQVTVTTDAAVGPDGNTTADAIIDNTTNATHEITQSVAKAASSLAYTVTVFAKFSGGQPVVYLELANGASTAGHGQAFNVQTGALAGAVNFGAGFTAGTDSITALGNGWYRLRVSATTDADATIKAVIRSSSSAYAGSGAAVVYLWGAQLEQASTATSYIPTTSASVTRSADVPAVASVGGVFSPSESTALVEFSLLWKPTDQAAAPPQIVYEFSDGTDNERFGVYAGRGGLDIFAQYTIDGGVTQADTATGAVAADTAYRAAAAYKLNDHAVSVNGSAAATDAAVTMPTVDRLYLGSSHAIATRELNGHIRRFTYYPKRISNAKLQSGTASATYVDAQRIPTARYWRIDIEDAALADNLQVGRVFLGPSWTISQAMLYGWSVMEVDPSNVTKSRGGQSFPDAVAKYRALDFTLDFLSEASIFDNAFAMARANGTVKDILAIPLEAGSYISEQSVWGRIISQEPLIHRLSQIFRQKFTVEERL